ncbi:hypothetical protein LTS18_003019 [Coniosporium uncinatum]|uniref:Uncharacterized protein n=1 Tax=Coniosporium uncinatum TaxID=93489 RepID=A0ACC3D7U6_9PEZI|nr:hypothetical protein LTS18_003019 [Coniosporium uncinatum]
MQIAIYDMDVNVFAKSKHVGSEKWWREHGEAPPEIPEPPEGSPLRGRLRRQRRPPTLPQLNFTADSTGSDTHTPDSHYDNNDVDDTHNDDLIATPSTDPDHDSQTMLLGRIFHFDSALTFDGSPLVHRPQISEAQLSLAKPGNKTEAGGTERWERVLQFPFELVVRGVLQYGLPLSSRVVRAPVGGAVVVVPGRGVEGQGKGEERTWRVIGAGKLQVGRPWVE